MVYMQCFFGFPTFFHTLKALLMRRMNIQIIKQENNKNSINNKNKK